MQARSESADFAKSRDRDGAPGAAARGTRRARSAAQTLPGQMVFIELWETFYSEAEKLYEEHPAHVRTCPRPPPDACLCERAPPMLSAHETNCSLRALCRRATL